MCQHSTKLSLILQVLTIKRTHLVCTGFQGVILSHTPLLCLQLLIRWVSDYHVASSSESRQLGRRVSET